MKKLKKQFQTTSKLASEMVINRENYFSSKSENWQESDKGMDYQEKTDALSEALDIINEGIDLIQ